MARGETITYYIAADTSDFKAGMAGAAAEAAAAGGSIDRSLSGTSKRSQNNFKDIQNSARKTASSIRAFGTALQGFQTTSIIIGVTALVGVVVELAGAVAAAGSTLSVLAPAFVQGGAASLTLRAGLFGLSDALDAISKNDPDAFAKSLRNLGPAATSTALALGGLNLALNSIKLNTQQALLDNVGKTLLNLGGAILPTVNIGFQQIGQSLNGAFKEAARFASSPAFSGLLASIFSDTARTVSTLTGAIGPLLTIFANIYGITAPYVQLLAQFLVSLSRTAAAYLSSAGGAAAFNLAIAQGVVALQQIGGLISSVFNFLRAVFATAVSSGNNLITTLTQIFNAMTAFVNSAKGQQDLISFFSFTALVLNTVASAAGFLLQGFFSVLNVITSLDPSIQRLIVGFLAVVLAVVPLGTYLLSLGGAIGVLGSAIFNLVQQAFVVATSLGAIAGIALLVGGGLIVLGSIIKGPLGSAMIVIGAAIVAFIGLNALMAYISNIAAGSILREGYAAITASANQEILAFATGAAASTMLLLAEASTAAGGGLGLAARGAQILQASLIPLLVLAIGIGIILGMLGVFSGKAAKAQSTTSGLGNSLTALQKSLKSVGSTGSKAGNGGLADLNTSLAQIGDSSEAAQGSLASFDKMNVLTDNSAAGAGAGIPGLPTIPSAASLGDAAGFNGSLGSPTIDTADFDKAIGDMTGQFNGLQTQLDSPFTNPFASIGEFIKANPLPFFIAFAVILGIIIALFVTGAVSISVATLPLTLIVVAIIAIIAIVILLVQNWSTVWAVIQEVVNIVVNAITSYVDGFINFFGAGLTAIGQFFSDVFNNVAKFVGDVLNNIGNFFKTVFAAIAVVVQFYINVYIAIFTFAYNAVINVWNFLVAVFKAIFDAIGNAVSFVVTAIINYFKFAFSVVSAVWNAIIAFFQGVWNNIMVIFGAVGEFFSGVFGFAVSVIRGVFNGVLNFFGDLWTNIKGIFAGVAGFFADVFKGAFNGVAGFIEGFVNNAITLINKLIEGINAITGKLGIPKIPNIPRVSLPRLAKGGIVTQSTVAEIGENGAEAVMPLQNNTEWIDMLAKKINSSNGGNSSQPLNVTVELDGTKLGQIIIDQINEKTQMTGRNSILV